jgi:hypothetical protein
VKKLVVFGRNILDIAISLSFRLWSFHFGWAWPDRRGLCERWVYFALGKNCFQFVQLLYYRGEGGRPLTRSWRRRAPLCLHRQRAQPRLLLASPSSLATAEILVASGRNSEAAPAERGTGGGRRGGGRVTGIGDKEGRVGG